MYIRLYKSLSLFHIVSEKCKKIQLTSRSVTLHHVVHHHSADCRWVWAKRWELKLSDCDSIQIWWHDIARCTDSHGLHRCRVALGGLVALAAMWQPMWHCVAFISAFCFAFFLCWRLWKTAAYQRPLLDSSTFDRQRPEWRKTTDMSLPFSASAGQCSESECVGLLSIRIIKYHQASYPEFFLFSFLDLLVWCSAISASLIF